MNDKVKVFTGSGQLTVNKEEKNEEQPKYIKASGGKETVVSDKWWEKMEHPHCGTELCCGQCEGAKKYVKKND